MWGYLGLLPTNPTIAVTGSLTHDEPTCLTHDGPTCLTHDGPTCLTHDRLTCRTYDGPTCVAPGWNPCSLRQRNPAWSFENFWRTGVNLSENNSKHDYFPNRTMDLLFLLA